MQSLSIGTGGRYKKWGSNYRSDRGQLDEEMKKGLVLIAALMYKDSN